MSGQFLPAAIKKKMKDNKRKAQSMLEYAMVIACIAGALIAMQAYITRSMQGKFRDAADEIGEQYSPESTKSNLTQSISSLVTMKGTPTFKRDPATGREYEIMEAERNEDTILTTEAGSFEETGSYAMPISPGSY